MLWKLIVFKTKVRTVSSEKEVGRLHFIQGDQRGFLEKMWLDLGFGEEKDQIEGEFQTVGRIDEKHWTEKFNSSQADEVYSRESMGKMKR